MINRYENYEENGKSPYSSFHNDLRYLSKVILQPLGVSSFNDENQNKPSRRIISPMGSKYRCWETLMVILVAYSAWVYPFEVALLNNNITLRRRLYIADNIVDLFFAVDIFLTFCVAYIDPITHLLVGDSRKIVKRLGALGPGSGFRPNQALLICSRTSKFENYSTVAGLWVRPDTTVIDRPGGLQAGQAAGRV